MARYLCALLKHKSEQKLGSKTKTLLNIAGSISPLVALDTHTALQHSEIGINIDVTGCERLFKGESNIVRQLKKKFQKLEFQSRICIAPSLGAAWALSRYSKTPYLLVRQDQLRDALRTLPVEGLRLRADTLSALKEMNLCYIGELLALSQRALHTRFDKELPERLNQALGRIQEILTPLRIQLPRKLSYDFQSPIKNRAQIISISERLLEELMSETQREGEKISQLLIELFPAEGEVRIVKNILLSAPSLRKEHVWSLLKLQLESITFYQPISSISLQSIKTQSLSAEHVHSLTGEHTAHTHSEKQLGELLDTLATHLGANAFHSLQATPSHIPEESFHYEAGEEGKLISLQKNTSVKEHVVQTERPSLLFHSPRPIRAMALLPDSPPFWLSWRNEKYQLLTSIGPERIAPKWWGEDESLFLTRDYFKVQLPEGSWLWIFRHLETSQWFAHGLWV